jgi:hypothetical protein
VLLIRQLSRLISIAEEEGAQEKMLAPNRQYGAIQLPAPPAAVGSVTENTTRTFDPAYKDTQSQK